MYRDATDLLVVTELSDIHREGVAWDTNIFRIGLLIPMCGSAGIWAPSCISCAQVAVAELNRKGGIGGQQVQMVMIDAAIETCALVEEVVNGLIENRGIDAIVGMHISAVRQRLSKVVRKRIPYIYTPLYEGGETTPGIFAIGDTPDKQLAPSLSALQGIYQLKGWALVGNDYVWPRSFNSHAKYFLKDLGVAIRHEEYVPFGRADMDRLVERVAESKADAVLLSLVGQDAISFNRAFGRAGLDERMIRLSCAIEENGLLASGPRNVQRLFSVSSYFATLETEANAAFREVYYSIHGEHAPVLNTLGQSTYEGVHFLAGLMQHKHEKWRDLSFERLRDLPRKTVRKADGAEGRGGPVYLARADDLKFEVLKKL